MASRLGTAWWRRVAFNQSPPGKDTAVVSPAPVSSLGLRLTGDPQLLDRLVAVRPDTVAVVFADGAAPRLAHPGERLRPRLLPGVNPLRVLVVNTAPISLDVTMAKLTTLDGFEIERTTIRLSVQLVDDNRFAPVQELAAEFGSDLEAHLLRRVENEVVGGVQGAIRMNRLADVRRLTLAGLLESRWLPESFAGGALVRREFTVLGVVWPPEPAARPAVAATPERSDRPAAIAGRAAGGARAPEPKFSLRVDDKLAKIWSEQVGSELHGIAGAQVDHESTVIVVPVSEPGAYESSLAKESFAGHFDDRRVHVVVAVADSYSDLVRIWFKQVDGSPGRLVAVQTRDASVLRVVVDRALASRQELENGLVVGSRADREALRQLVPQGRIAFVAADPAG